MTTTELTGAIEDAIGGAGPTDKILSLKDQAFEVIRQRIICSEYAPGEFLSEARISEELGLGRMPVRQALDRLMMMNMVKILPRKGIMVAPVSFDEVDQLIEVRLLNEGHCAALAARRVTPDGIAQLRAILDEARTETDKRNRRRLMELDREFHTAIASAACNKVLASLLASLHDRSLRFWFISLGEERHLGRIEEEHLHIFNAIEANDAAAAAAAVKTHIESFRANIMRTA